MIWLRNVCNLCNNCSAKDLTASGQRFDTKPEITIATTGPTLKPVGAELPAEVTSSLSPRRPTSGRHAPPSPLIRHSSSASTTVFADVHRGAAAHPPRTNSVSPQRPRDQTRPEVVASRQIPQRQRFAVPEDRGGRVLRRPVAEFSTVHDQRQWTSLEHGVVDGRRSAVTERPTRRVHSYEDRYLLQRQKGMQSLTSVMMPHVRRRLPNANDPLRITEFSTGDDEDDFETGRYGIARSRAPISPARQ